MNISIIGTGKIVQEALPVIAATDGIFIRSILAREHSLQRAEAMAETYGIPLVCTDYEAVLTDDVVEVVYIALINSVHFSYAMRALQAGKHVILEKPACLCAEEFQQLVEEARARHLMLMEAVTLLHLPSFKILREELLELLGTIRHVECNYSQRSSRYDAYLRGEVLPAFDPEAGGGALMDLNIYNLHFVLSLLGRPYRATYLCCRGFNEVDLTGTAVLEYSEDQGSSKSSVIALLTSSKTTDAPSFGLLQGDCGWLRIDGPVSTLSSITLCLRGHQPRQIPLSPVSHRLAPEFAAFADLFHHQDYETMNQLLDHSLAVMQTLDELRKNENKKM